MKLHTSLILSLLLLPCVGIFSQKIPEGYLLQYHQKYSDVKSLSDFHFQNTGEWGIFKSAGNYFLQCAASFPVKNLPSNLAILTNKVFGDFILEIDVMPVADSNNYSDLCLFLGLKDSSSYYYVNLTRKSDSINCSINLVKDFLTSPLTNEISKTVSWKENTWHKIRIERDIVKRKILVYIDVMDIPAIQVKNYELVMGSIGLGSITSSVRFDNLSIWAPTVIRDEDVVK